VVAVLRTRGAHRANVHAGCRRRARGMTDLRVTSPLSNPEAARAALLRLRGAPIRTARSTVGAWLVGSVSRVGGELCVRRSVDRASDV
jgi:hypothetical protein